MKLQHISNHKAHFSSALFWFYQVKMELLVEALTKRKTVTVNDKLILPYSHSEVKLSALILL